MSTYDELLSSLDEENTWRADGIFLDLHEDLTSTATVRYDVASIIVDCASKFDRVSTPLRLFDFEFEFEK